MSLPAYSPQARNDLREIATYLAPRNAAAARRTIESLRRRGRLLARQPGLGLRRDDLAPGIRTSVVWPHVIFYRELPTGIRIERVLHGARDIDAIFHSRDEEE